MNKDIQRRGGLVGHRTNVDLLEDLYLILIRSQIFLEVCNRD